MDEAEAAKIESPSADDQPETPTNGADSNSCDQTSENGSPDPTHASHPSNLPDSVAETFLVDAIGSTLYSKRFVLKTILSLNTLESGISEDFEKDLCALWDMTIEEDVVKLLLEHNVLEIFSSTIQMTEDQRLIEILVGIIGNMCSVVTEARDILRQQPEVIGPIIELVACPDSLVLIQVMRVFHSCLVFDNTGDELTWFDHFNSVEQFVEKFAFILSNATSSTLLEQAYEALNAICTKLAVIEFQAADTESKLGFRDMFVRPELIEGVLSAFEQLFPSTIPTTKKSRRILNLFLDIGVVLTQYEQHSVDTFVPFMDRFYGCIAKCLNVICHPMHLLPLTIGEQLLIENVNEISQSLDNYFSVACFWRAITIWSIVERTQTEKGNEEGLEWDDEVIKSSNDDGSEEVNSSDLSMTLLEFITQTCKLATLEEVTESIGSLESSAIVIKLCGALSAGSSEEEDIAECHDKLKEAAKLVWNIDIESITANGN